MTHEEKRLEMATYVGTMQNPHLDGAPFRFDGDETGVLLIHGYTATPAEMRPLGEYLAERGCSVLGPRLPGHGTTPEDLSRVYWRDWVAHVLGAYEELRSRCGRVFVCGESLGGLLALHLAETHPDLAGVIALAPALRVTSRLIYLAPLLRFLVRSVPKRRSGGSESVVDARWQGYTVDVPAAAAQLLALQRRVVRRAESVRQPLLILQGKFDKTVDQGSVQAFYDKAASQDKTLIWLEHSGHCVAIDQEYEMVAQHVAGFVERLSK